MITEIKEIKKELNAALKHFKNALELTKSNTIVEIISPRTNRVRKPRELATGPVAPIPEKKPRERRAKKLPDLDEKGYMKERQPTTQE